MNLDEQRRFFLLEFYSWAEQFVRCSTVAIIALLGVAVAQSFFSNGGLDAQFLVYTFGLLSLGVGMQLLIFLARIGRGFRLSGLTAAFLPWLALMALDAFVLPGEPWRSKYALAVNLLPVMAFFTALHVARTKRTRWWLIALMSILALVSGMKTFLFSGAEDVVAQESGRGIGMTIRSIFGSLGGEVGLGSVLLLAFFPMALLVVSARFKVWVRFFGVYAAAMFLLGIAFTRHVGVYAGLVAGGLLAVLLLVRGTVARIVLFAAILAFGWFAATHSNTNVGFLKTVPVSDSVRQHFSEEERLAGTRLLLPHAAWEMFKKNPVFGVGSDRFSVEFEKYRTPQWQATPQTAGSLFLQILAENGCVGVLLFFGPLAYLFARGIRACREMPWQSDTERALLRRKMGQLDLGSLPEERVSLAGTLSGLFAVFVLLCIDYPNRIPGVLLACGIFGGIAAFIMAQGRQKMLIYSGRRRHVLFAFAFLAPVGFMFLFLPYFRAESEYDKGRKELLPFFADVATGLPSDAENRDFSRLNEAEAHLRAALRKNPEHGDAWAALAQKFVFDCQNNPQETSRYGKLIRYAANRALTCSNSVPEFYRLRAISEMMEEDYSAAKEDLIRADAMSPFNSAQLLLSGEIFRMCPDGTSEARNRLSRVFAMLPQAYDVERKIALMSLDNQDEGEKTRDKPPAQIVVPEF